MKILKRVAITAAMGVMAAAAPASAATLLVDGNGKLTGANGVSVTTTAGTSLYNVEFLDGACTTLFSGCDSASDFAFNTMAFASAAANALLDQVFINSAAGQFDSSPGLTRGCTGATCSTYIPYGFASNVENVTFSRSNNSGSSDSIATGTIDKDTDLTSSSSSNYARFTIAAVPEPATWAMMLVGFGAVGGAARYRRRKSTIAYA